MASFEWSQLHNSYIKQCTSCSEIFIGAATQQASEAIFSKNFCMGGRSNLDGLHTSCNLCRSGKVYGYSITHEEKRALYKKQNGRCPICLEDLAYDKARIDHCHSSGIIRGMLHTQCNSQLGFYENNKERIRQYLGELNEDN